MVDMDEIRTAAGLFERAAALWPDSDALVFPDGRRTYAALRQGAAGRARSLAALGVGRGDHVGLLMPNGIEFVELVWAIALLGAVLVPVNVRYKARELRYVLENADVSVLLTSDAMKPHVDFEALLRDALPGLGGDPMALHPAGAPRLRSVVIFGAGAGEGFVGQAAFEAMTDPDLALPVPVDSDDTGIIMYTSGTTANPKGCLVPHHALVGSAVDLWRYRYAIGPDDRMWNPLPAFHISFLLPLMCVFCGGGAMVSQRHFDAGEALMLIERECATWIWPSFEAICADLMNHADFPRRDLSSVKRINAVGGRGLLQRFQEAFPGAVQTAAYGLTESCGIVCAGMPEDGLEERLTTNGRALPGVELRVVDRETGETLGPGEKGELLIRSGAIFSGYYKDPAKSAETLRDGWLHTGDLCSLDEGGRVRFHGRVKDMLKVGGENVAAVEIESFLMAHPAVKLAQVVGVADERLGEVPAAFIELAPGGALDGAGVIAHCRGQIASYKIPRYVRFVTEWPMSATKVRKPDLLNLPLGERLA
ncbi:MAG: AMP-binding protein [Alphaproteobacteria bacterium]|nr:AMP-binding protein [Alphaproteobacteria bacterium]